MSQCAPTAGKPYGLTITIDGDIIKASGIPSSEVTEEGQYSFAVASCAQTELRGKGYKVTAFAIKGKISSAWGLRTEDESSLAISAKLTPGVNTDIQFRLMVSKDTPAAYAPYANIRPIHGRTQVKVERCGENLLDLSPNNVESGIYNNGEKSDGAAGQQRTITPTMVNPKQALVYTTDSRLKYNLRATFFSAAGEYLSNIGLTPDTVFKVPDNAHQMFIHSNGYGLIGNDAPWYEISVGTTPPDAYSPYTADDYTLIFPKEVMGADVDVTTSAGQETWALETIDAVMWAQDIGSTVRCATTLSKRAVTAIPGSAISDWLVEKVSFVADTESFYTNQSQAYIKISKTRLASYDRAGVNAYLSEHPITIAYKLATPVPFTATSGGTIKALSGTNTVLTDADKATVKGYEDLPHAINEMRQAVVAAAEGV